MSSAIHTTAVSQDDTASAPSAPPPAPTKSDEPSRPVEMENLAPPQPSTAPPPTSTDHPSTPAPPPDHDTSINPPGTSTPAEPAALGRSNTVESALGPEGAAPAALPPDSSEPVLRITLMLTTGARHPYTISSKYLASRKVTALDGHGNFDPREMSAYKLKELIWTDWRPEWEPKPRDPGAIRLIILGRMLEDKSQLKGELAVSFLCGRTFAQQTR